MSGYLFVYRRGLAFLRIFLMFILFDPLGTLLSRRWYQRLLLFSIVFSCSFGSLVAAQPSTRPLADPFANYIQRIILTPAKYLSKREQDKLLAPYVHTFLSPARIQQLIREIRAHYILKGYPTVNAQVVLDPTAPAGTLKIELIHGFIERIRLRDNGVRDRLRLATAFPFLRGSPLYLPALGQGIDQLNSVPSSQAAMTILPGTFPGGSVIQINDLGSHPWRVDLGTDNLGEKAAGKWRGKVNIALDNLLSINDQWTFHYSINKSKKEVIKQQKKEEENSFFSPSYKAGFSFPLGAYHLSSAYSASISLTPTFHNDRYQATYKTESSSLSFRVKRALFQNSTHKTFAEAEITHKDTASQVADTLIDNQSRTLSVGHGTLSYTGLLVGGQTTASVSYQQGLPLWGARKDPAPSGVDTFKAQFKKVDLSLLWVRFFQLPLQKMLQYQFQYASQHSLDRLFGSEQMSLSGLDRIRGLTTSASADQGFFMRQELSLVGLFSFSPLTAPLQPCIGLDGGYTLEATEGNKSLWGWAAGCKYQGHGLHGDITYARSLKGKKGHKLYMSLSLNIHQLFTART